MKINRITCVNNASRHLVSAILDHVTNVNLESHASMSDPNRSGVCFPPRKRKNCEVNCCVFNCNSSAQKIPNIRFYQFPKENASPVMVRNSFGALEQSSKLQCWIQALRIGKKTINLWIVNKNINNKLFVYITLRNCRTILCTKNKKEWFNFYSTIIIIIVIVVSREKKTNDIVL